MEREKTSGSKDDRKLGIATEVTGAIAGIATGAATFWLELRSKFYHALEKTSVYDEAKKIRDPALKALKRDDPKLFEKHSAIVSEYKTATDTIHKELGVKKVSLNSLKSRWGTTSKSDRLEMIEKAGTFGFMAATLIIGCGVLLEISRNQKLKHQIEEKELAQAQSPAKT